MPFPNRRHLVELLAAVGRGHEASVQAYLRRRQQWTKGHVCAVALTRQSAACRCFGGAPPRKARQRHHQRAPHPRRRRRVQILSLGDTDPTPLVYNGRRRASEGVDLIRATRSEREVGAV
eukprot:scaffold119489_cov28-Tisochrysis_lutea.AAC.14